MRPGFAVKDTLGVGLPPLLLVVVARTVTVVVAEAVLPLLVQSIE